ncbi:MAG: hypothetical protein IPP90_12535 [Gemmatimonadaceae bacterium]|nr:hypothetical protein [Gemmatimonadaceae bacterium]
MPLTNFQFSASYTYLDQALRARWDSFRALEREMDSFVPRPADDYQPKRDLELARLRVLNPDHDPDQLAAFVDKQTEFASSPTWQFHERFDARHMAEYVTVTVIAQALSEALINAVLAIGLANAGSADLFPLIERAEFKDKWLAGPKSFAPGFEFPKGSALHETLVALSKQRNSLAHHKVQLSVDAEQVLAGSKFERLQLTEERSWFRRYFSLPYDLAELAHRTLPDVPLFGLLSDRAPIERAPQHDT